MDGKALGFQDFRGAIASARTIVETVHVPALGGTVAIGKMSARDKDLVQQALLDAKLAGVYRARVVIAVACTPAGQRLFAAADEAWLADLDAEVLDPIVAAADRAAPRGGPEKNAGAPPAASATGSP